MKIESIYKYIDNASTEEVEEILQYIIDRFDLTLEEEIKKPKKKHNYNFSVGEKVSFEDDDGCIRFGSIIKENKKSANVECSNGLTTQEWRVEYTNLKKLKKIA